MSRSSRVCILTAGRGTRLGKYTSLCNKALLPLGERAVISRILEKFPLDFEVVVALGDRGNDVRDYLLSAHPERRFDFVEVDRFEGRGTGPGYSLAACHAHLLEKPFYFVASDTLWEGELPELSHSWMAVADLPAGESSARFCNLQVDEGGRVQAIQDKHAVSGPDWKVFTGLGWVKDPGAFFEALAYGAAVAGEKQVSAGFARFIHQGGLRAVSLGWQDVGTERAYEVARASSQAFDFSKSEEIFYAEGDRIVKYFALPEGARTRAERAHLLGEAVPPGVIQRGHYLSYPRVSGRTFYTAGSVEAFQRLLEHLPKMLWRAHAVDTREVSERCLLFYRDKTLQRVAALEKKWGREAWLGAEKVHLGEGPLPPTAQLLESVPWEELSRGRAVGFHGDLQFDNVICHESGFTLVDWRTDFAGSTRWGDWRYDLAKLLGGIRMNYGAIKQNQFRYEETGGRASLQIPTATDADRLEALLKARCVDWKVDFQTLEWIVALIYLNMAPLHQAPFDRLLFVLARQKLSDLSRGRALARSA